MRKARLVLGVFLAITLLVAGKAYAQTAAGASLVQTMPPGPVNVGDTLPPAAQVMLLTLTNETEDAGGAPTPDYIAAVRVAFTPSCQASALQSCPNANKDPGVFEINATATGAAGSSCSGVSYNVVPDPTDVNATGRLLFEGVTTTLNMPGNLSAVATQVVVASNVGFILQNIKFLIQIDNEVMLVTAGQAGTTWTVTRGFLGTVAAAHTNGAVVKQPTTLGPTDNSGGPTFCVINFTGTVKKVPLGDASADPGIQTVSIAGGSFTNNVGSAQQFPWGAASATTVTGPGVTITKAPVGGAINAGQNATFTITVANNGANATGPATNVVITDTLPTGVTWALQSPVTGCSIAAGPPQVLNCTLPGPIAVGQSLQIVVTAPTSAQTPQCMTAGPFTNVASLTGTNGVQFPEPTLSNTADIACSQVTSTLTASKNDGVAAYTPGTSVTYTIVVGNPAGPSDAIGATVSDPKPPQVTSWTWTCSPGATGGATGCTGTGSTTADFTDTVNLPIGSTISYTVTALISSAATGDLVNTVTVTPPQGTPGTATDIDTPAPVANLVVSKTNGQSAVPYGTNTTYMISVQNTGPSNVTGAILSDPAASGLTKIGVACLVGTPGQCVTPPTIGQLEGGAFALPTLAPGQTYNLTVTATVTSLSGSVTNSASVNPPAGTTTTGSGCTSSDGITRVFDNPTCISSDTDTVNYPAFSVQKTPSSGTLEPNRPLTFTITVTNTGLADADGAIVTDILPSGFTPASAVCTSGPSCPAGDLLAALGGAGVVLSDFPAGASYVFTVSGTFTLTSGSLTNTATVCPPSILGNLVNCVPGTTTVTVLLPIANIPTLSEYALMALMLMLATMGGLYLRRARW